jgi:hypothetical protein
VLPSVCQQLAVFMDIHNQSDELQGSISGLQVIGNRGYPVSVNPGMSGRYVAPGAMLTLCLKVGITEMVDTVSNEEGGGRWVIPMEDGAEDSNVIDELLRLHFGVRFAKEHRAEMLESRHEKAPRTISQVREDRQTNSFSGNIVDVEGSADAFDEGRGIPHLDVIALKENCIILTYMWRLGDHHGIRTCWLKLPTLSVKASQPQLTRRLKTFDSINDAIICRLTHPTSVVMTGSNKLLTVVLEIKSYSDSPIFYTVEAIDTIKELDMADSRQLGTQQHVLSDSLRWIGKTSYLQSQIGSYGVAQLTFTASISTTGVFDLKR